MLPSHIASDLACPASQAASSLLKRIDRAVEHEMHKLVKLVFELD
jgi:hypothetical protein